MSKKLKKILPTRALNKDLSPPMSSLVIPHTSSPSGTLIVQSSDGDYFTTSQFFLIKSCLDRLKDYVSYDIRKSLKNGIDYARSSKTHVTINVSAKVYCMLEASNRAGDVLNPKSFGFTKSRTVVGVVGATPVIRLGDTGFGAAPMPFITADSGISVLGASPMAVVGGHGIGSFLPVHRLTTPSSGSIPKKSIDYFHSMVTWHQTKKKIGRCFSKKFHTWCIEKKNWPFDYDDDSSVIPGRFVIEFEKKKWHIKEEVDEDYGLPNKSI